MRFAFGNNWQKLTISEEQIRAAEASLVEWFGSLDGKTFLDIGSGSGLFSLAAHNLGARVRSFDYDPQSVECTERLSDGRWSVERGDILDPDYVSRLGKFDIVYSWGVLHHTGNMEQAIENAKSLTTDKLMIAIYNDQGVLSTYWKGVKRLYNTPLKPLVVVSQLPLYLARVAYRAVTGRLLQRGMNLWRDCIDWIGGYPFEVATPEKISGLCQPLQLSKSLLTKRQGCNQFLFIR